MAIKQHHDHPDIPQITLTDENLTTLVTFNVEFIRSMEAIAIEIINSVNALDQFVVEAQVVANGAFIAIADVAADFTEATLAPLIRKSRPVFTALGLETGILVIDTRGLFGLRLRAARSSGSNSVITIKAGGD